MKSNRLLLTESYMSGHYMHTFPGFYLVFHPLHLLPFGLSFWVSSLQGHIQPGLMTQLDRDLQVQHTIYFKFL